MLKSICQRTQHHLPTIHIYKNETERNVADRTLKLMEQGVRRESNKALEALHSKVYDILPVGAGEDIVCYL
jgi:hypothetical protein